MLENLARCMQGNTAFFECPSYKPKGNPRKNFLVDGSINPKEEMDHAMAVKRGHETATSDPGVTQVQKRVKVADLVQEGADLILRI